MLRGLPPYECSHSSQTATGPLRPTASFRGRRSLFVSHARTDCGRAILVRRPVLLSPDRAAALVRRFFSSSHIMSEISRCHNRSGSIFPRLAICPCLSPVPFRHWKSGIELPLSSCCLNAGEASTRGTCLFRKCQITSRLGQLQSRVCLGRHRTHPPSFTNTLGIPCPCKQVRHCSTHLSNGHVSRSRHKA